MKPFHKQATNVYVTNDYDMFLNYDENRDFNMAVVNNLTKIFNRRKKNPNIGIENAFVGVVIVVRKKKNGKLVFMKKDGKHRVEGAKNAQIPFRYEIQQYEETYEEEMQSMIELNISAHNWTNDEYAKHYTQSKNSKVREVYETILSLKKEFSMSFTTIVGVIEGEKFKGLDNFKAGNIEIENKKDVRRMLEYLKQYRTEIKTSKAYIMRNLVSIIGRKEYKHLLMLDYMKKSVRLNKVNIEKETDFKPHLQEGFNKICNPKQKFEIKKKIAA